MICDGGRGHNFCCTLFARGGLTVGRLAHNQEIAGSNPVPATNEDTQLVGPCRFCALGGPTIARFRGGPTFFLS